MVVCWSGGDHKSLDRRLCPVAEPTCTLPERIIKCARGAADGTDPAAAGRLVIDYGVKVSAESDAYADAQSVARIAADAGTYGHHGGVDSTRAVAEGRQALAAANLNGDVWVEGEMVHVRTSKTAKTYFLGIVGLSQVTGTAEASSRMVTSDNR